MNAFDLEKISTSYFQGLDLLTPEQFNQREQPTNRARLQHIYQEIIDGRHVSLGILRDTRTSPNPFALMKGGDPSNPALYDGDDDYLTFHLDIEREGTQPHADLVQLLRTETLSSAECKEIGRTPFPQNIRTLDIYVTDLAHQHGLDLLRDAETEQDSEREYLAEHPL